MYKRPSSKPLKFSKSFLKGLKQDSNSVFDISTKCLLSIISYRKKLLKLCQYLLALPGEDELTGNEDKPMAGKANYHVAQSLFPSTLCSAFVEIIALLDDQAVSLDGTAVYEVAYQVIWSCLVEDSNLFLKYFMEKLTRDNPEEMFQILRSLIRFIPKLPTQAAFALYNYIIGYIMFYVRHPKERGQDLVGQALATLWMVVHSVHGIMFKDLKQILRKEQVRRDQGFKLT